MKNKYFFFSIFILVSLFVGLWLFNPSNAFAQACSGNTDPCIYTQVGCRSTSISCNGGQCAYSWECNQYCSYGWSAWSACTGGYQTRECGQYQYQIQRCGGGGGGQADTVYGPSCTGNYVVDYSKPLSSACGLPWKDVNYIQGNAEVQGGCCQTAGGGRTCGDWYKCPTRNNPNKMCRDCEEQPEYCAKYSYTTYACKLNCDPNVWGAWSACSATCGGGISTRTNACGNIQGQTCNTQSCQGPWWQVNDGDITSSGDIVSRLPSGKYLNTVGSGGFPGIPVYNGQIGTAPGTISSTGWNANTETSLTRIFNYSFFENLIPDDVVSGQIYSDGYKWTMITGDYTLPATNFGSTKNILFVNGNLTINGNINVDDNVGFFLVIVKGTITINPTVTEIEGIYETDAGLTTGLGTTQLKVRGSVASYGGITLQRDLPDDTVTPAELFEFAPDQVVLFPQKLMFKRFKWAEVAP